MKIKLLFLIILFLSQDYKNNLLSVFDSNKNNSHFYLDLKKIKKKFYDFDYSFVKKEKKIILNITIKPLKGFKLNGDSYPPINIELKEMIKKDNTIIENNKSKIFLNPKKISYKGIKEDETKSFLIEIKNFETNFLIEVSLKMIACSSSSCFMINDKILLEYKE